MILIPLTYCHRHDHHHQPQQQQQGFLVSCNILNIMCESCFVSRKNVFLWRRLIESDKRHTHNSHRVSSWWKSDLQCVQDCEKNIYLVVVVQCFLLTTWWVTGTIWISRTLFMLRLPWLILFTPLVSLVKKITSKNKKSLSFF